MVSAIGRTIDSGQVPEGASVYLETVPMPFLRVAPLVEGEWLDRYVAGWAELGAMLIDRGYQKQEAGDEHPLAWPHFTNSSGSEIDQDEMGIICKQVSQRLKRFPGRTKEIGGRPYVSFGDYCSWRGRKVKGDLRSGVSTGLTTAGWNTWLYADYAKGRLAGVAVARLQCCVGKNDYLVCPDGVEGQLERRALLLSIARKAGSFKTIPEEGCWQDIAGELLTRLYAFR